MSVTARTRIALVARIGAKKWPERWSNDYFFVLEATEFALILFFGQAAENQGSSYILRGQREGAQLFLTVPLLVCLAPAIAYLH